MIKKHNLLGYLTTLAVDVTIHMNVIIYVHLYLEYQFKFVTNIKML